MYGAPVTAPIEIPQEPPSYFSQVPAPLPEMKDATVGTLRLEGTLAKRLPPMPSGELQNLSFTNSKQLEVAQQQYDELVQKLRKTQSQAQKVTFILM